MSAGWRGEGRASAEIVGFFFRGDGGQSASGAVKGGWGRVSFGVGWWCRRRFFFRGDGGESASGAVKGAALELGGVVVGFFFSGGRGRFSFRGCEGNDLSQLWSWVVVSSSGRGPVSFRGCEGGMI